MLHGVRVVVVVPAFLEAPRIARVLRSMPPEVDHVVVVDDASTDETAARAREVNDPRLEVITHDANRGVGAAIVTGYARALSLTHDPRDAFVVMAGDGQMDPRDLPSLVAPIAAGAAGYVKGNRFLDPNIDRIMPRARRIGGLAFSWLTSKAIGQRVHDSQCGYTAIARDACMRIDRTGLWPRYGYPNDLLGQLAVRHVAIAEVPVRPIYADEQSKLRPRHLFAIATLVARAYVRRKLTADRSLE